MQARQPNYPVLSHAVSHRLHRFRSQVRCAFEFFEKPGPSAASPATATLADADFKSLESKIPRGLGASNHAKSAPALPNLGEGNIVEVIAYLYFA